MDSLRAENVSEMIPTLKSVTRKIKSLRRKGKTNKKCSFTEAHLPVQEIVEENAKSREL